MVAQSIYKSPAGERAVMDLYEAQLARWPAPHARLTLPTRHGETFVIASGDEGAPPLILLHGAGSNSAMWVHDAAEYGRRHRVLAVDLPGEPGKSSQLRPSWQGPAYVEWLEDVLAGLGIDTAAFVGLSQGGWTALKFAVARPERVGALALLNPGGITRDKASFILRALPLSLLGAWGIRRINRMVLAGQPVPAETEAAMTLLMTHFKPRIGALPIFTDDELRRLSMPVLLLAGGRDALRDAERIADRMRRLVPALSATIIPEAGHAIVNAGPYVRRFLAAVA